MPVANPQKKISVSSMDCGGVATVTLGFQSAASLAFTPADIVLIMDRSASMTEERMAYAKAAADLFIDMVDGARDGATRMGIVSFAEEATEDVALTGIFTELKPAIEKLTGGGNANYQAGFQAAAGMLSHPGTSRRIAVLFAAGEIAGSTETDSAVQAMKDQGIEIFCIGLTADPSALNRWASDPDTIHGAYTEDPAQLDQAFREIAAEVILAGARDVVIREQLTQDFEILKIHDPDTGTVEVTGPQSLTWSIDATGIREQPDLTSLSFDIIHVGSSGGTVPVNQNISYSDREGNSLAFPSPTVEVICSGGGEIYPEPCPEPTELQIPGCQDALHSVLPAVSMQSLGRIVQVDVTIKGVCPGKRLAASILLSERDPEGISQTRGVKHVLIPAQTGDACRDITLRCVQFSVPETLDPQGDPNSICKERQFEARVIANYVDSDFQCCDVESEIL